MLAPLLAAAIAAAPPDAEASMFRRGEEHLATIERRVAADTGDAATRRERLRALYFLSVADEARLPQAERALSWLVAHGAIRRDLEDAYRGALEVVRAKHASWPPAKLDALKRARPLLDGAVARTPSDLEIRYLRLMSCYYLPFFFGRSWSVEADFAAIARLLPRSAGAYPPGLRAEVARFVVSNYRNLSAAEKALLVESIRLADAEARAGGAS